MAEWDDLARAAAPVAATTARGVVAAVYVTPHADPAGSPLAALLKVIAEAKHTIDFGIFSYSLDPVTAALIAARDRGVKVRGVLDLSQSSMGGGEMPKLKDAGIDFRVYAPPRGIFHLKVLIADAAYADLCRFVSGSWNWTSNAEHTNSEVLTVLSGRQVQKAIVPPVKALIDTGYADGLKP